MKPDNFFDVIKYIFYQNREICQNDVLGKNEEKHFLQIVTLGTPGLPVIMVNVTEVESSRYQIVWTTPSFTNIAEHLLIYKQVKVTDIC